MICENYLIKGKEFMTDNLFQKLEEKIMLLLAELDCMRKELSQLRQENASLKLEKTRHAQKIQEMIALMDMLDAVNGNMPVNVHETTSVQGEKEQIAVA